MKLFAQHGAQCGQKIDEGIRRKLLDGVIYSPRDISQTNLQAELTKLKVAKLEHMFDPQFYACVAAAGAESRIGFLGEDDYAAYFSAKTRRELERESTVRDIIARSLGFQATLDVSAYISPNIMIPRSLNSIEAVIAKNFIRNAMAEHKKLKLKRRLLVTLAIARDALIDKQELADFLNEITVLDDPPAGFYLLVGATSSEVRAEICHADTLSAWMLLNQALKVNGFETVNGYSDMFTPLLGAAGADAGCTGWFSNLRTFSLGRFSPAGGGRLPIPRYFSKRLINRVMFSELDSLRERFPQVLNGNKTDALYPRQGSEPQRNQEVLQSWETIRVLNGELVKDNARDSLLAWSKALDGAAELYAAISRARYALDTKSGDDHLEPIAVAIQLFAAAAEIKLSA
jgi:hypothetical protein